MQKLSLAASQHEALADYHESKGADSTRKGQNHHSLASLHHRGTMEQLHDNMEHHGARMIDIEHGHAQGSLQDMANIKLSNNFATEAIKKAARARTRARMIDFTREDLSSHKCESTKDAYHAATKAAVTHASSDYQHNQSLQPYAHLRQKS